MYIVVSRVKYLCIKIVPAAGKMQHLAQVTEGVATNSYLYLLHYTWLSARSSQSVAYCSAWHIPSSGCVALLLQVIL